MTDWKETTLWKHLEAATGPEAEAAQALLVQEMPRIQTILTQAHTAPTDFTLHDADHSFRVAKWMAEIIPADVLEKLSPYEITLLLLAAYLHDIGMTPEQGRVDRFWSHLVYGAPDPKGPRQPLTEEEGRDLQGWLDDEGRDLTIPLAPDGAASEETKRLADLLIAYYCRDKHKDWSGEWIKAHLRPQALPGYETWVDDLIQLCRSHHGGYDELKQSRFDPRPAGTSGRPVHHRYLACVLRVADVLEIDPERTPEVIFRHREIHPGSVLYWRKDHENWIIRDGNSLVLTACPESDVIAFAIRKTADGIKQELATCARLNREQPFYYWQLRSTQSLPHRWDLPEELAICVSSKHLSYREGPFIQSVAAASRNDVMEKKRVRAFVSYKWGSPAQNKWVEKFASDLRDLGIESILDIWEVRLGDSFTDYMTKKIQEAEVLLFIMTSASVAALESLGQGGALKFEMQLAAARRISGEMRIIPVYRGGNATPAYLRDHRYIDFRDDALYEEKIRELVDDLQGRDRRPPIRKIVVRHPC